MQAHSRGASADIAVQSGASTGSLAPAPCLVPRQSPDQEADVRHTDECAAEQPSGVFASACASPPAAARPPTRPPTHPPLPPRSRSGSTISLHRCSPIPFSLSNHRPPTNSINTHRLTETTPKTSQVRWGKTMKTKTTPDKPIRSSARLRSATSAHHAPGLALFCSVASGSVGL